MVSILGLSPTALVYNQLLGMLNNTEQLTFRLKDGSRLAYRGNSLDTFITAIEQGGVALVEQLSASLAQQTGAQQSGTEPIPETLRSLANEVT